jgi:BASS family bile acid:Na+ symporter
MFADVRISPARIRKAMQRMSMAIFIGFIVLGAGCELGTFFLSYAGAVAGLVMLHNALALLGRLSVGNG